ncbi:hypothetical protein [Paenibacillus woosongensis]|uniref:Uncharacterized protein n=1 Tax=Paenibacillus woosongensis TaxID=307580 RepID=A0ABQ4MPL1_9BACL|nr:hypothetical protein [Paenibacillus woosongensis]GIP57922.1 hypothetical protein J15TS10_17360 [Paenibacillus woosongensis]
MANRYANLTPSKDISQDFRTIDAGFDKVQQEMDANKSTANSHIANTDVHVTAAKKASWDGHLANTDIHVTAAQKAAWDAKADGSTSTELAAHIADQEVHVTQADHDKLGSIETGAQVNQNAFAKVNDIEAADPSSQFYIVGGIGITVTTNPNTGEITVTATGSAAPGAHGITHTEHGADPIPTATLTEGGLLSAAQLAEIITHGELLDEHAAAITDLEDRLDAAEVVPVTLQPGLQVITVAKDARFQLGEIRGKTEVNGQGRIGLIGVENPYTIATSRNLLPPVYEWDQPSTMLLKIDGDYRVSGASDGSVASRHITCTISAFEGLTYSFSVEGTGWEGQARKGAFVYFLDSSKVRIDNVRHFEGTFTAPAGTAYMTVFLTLENGESPESPNYPIGSFTLSKPMLTIGTDPKPFQPQQKAMLALQTELHANPTDGTDPDVLFQQDGQYSKLTKWKKVELDGTLSWSFSGSFSGYKNVRIPLTEGVVGSGYATKYDGIGLMNRGGVSSDPTAADQFNIFSNGYLYLTVANANSGWGDAYTPTADEIKAYFWGWTMCNQDGSVPWSGGTKYWKTVGKTGVADTATLPTSQAPNRALYNLLYRLSKETVEPVVSEGCLSLAEGDNMVEVGTGIVLREGAIPVKIGSYYVFNSMQSGYTNNPLKFKVDMFLAIYNKNREVIPAEFNNTFFPYGRYRATIFDWQYTPESIYSVTYTKLDKSPIVPITGSLVANEKAQISDLTAGVAEALQRVSVVEQKKAEKDAPTWIESPLLNGWARHSAENPTFRYYKDASGRVNFEAVIRSGAVVTGTQIASMPDGYKPDIMQKIKCYSANGSANASGLIEFTTDGLVRIGTSGNGTYYNAILIFRGSYLAKG